MFINCFHETQNLMILFKSIPSSMNQLLLHLKLQNFIYKLNKQKKIKIAIIKGVWADAFKFTPGSPSLH